MPEMARDRETGTGTEPAYGAWEGLRPGTPRDQHDSLRDAKRPAGIARRAVVVIG